jgi:hypothetical protein
VHLKTCEEGIPASSNLNRKRGNRYQRNRIIYKRKDVTQLTFLLKESYSML